MNIDLLDSFLRGVAANNSRPWLAEHRDTYDTLRAEWLADLDRLCAAMSQWCPGMATQNGRSSTYRFFRDTRFSPDKSPLKTFFSASLSPHGRKSHYAGYYMQVGPEGIAQNGLWGGIYCPDSTMLRKLRKAIVDNIEEFEGIINAPDIKRLYPGWEGDRLKSAPQGWPRNHPQIELLKLKDYGKFHQLPLDFFRSPTWPEEASELLRPLAPLVDFINYSLDE